MARPAAPVKRTTRFSRPDFVAYRYAPKSKHRFSRDRAASVISKRIANIPAGQRVWIRARGGTPEYRNRWWSTPAMDADELADMDEDDLLDMLRDLEDPWEIDIANTR